MGGGEVWQWEPETAGHLSRDRKQREVNARAQLACWLTGVTPIQGGPICSFNLFQKHLHRRTQKRYVCAGSSPVLQTMKINHSRCLPENEHDGKGEE